MLQKYKTMLGEHIRKCKHIMVLNLAYYRLYYMIKRLQNPLKPYQP